MVALALFVSANQPVRANELANQQGAFDAASFRMPLTFVKNEGQFSNQSEYAVSRGASSFSFFPDRVEMKLLGADAEFFQIASTQENPIELPQEPKATDLVLRFVGQNEKVEVIGSDRSETVSNFYQGSDPKNWRTAVPTFHKLVYRNVYPGIDLQFLERDGLLAYDFIVSPGADPSVIRIAIDGAESLGVTDSGDMDVQTKIGSIRFKKLKAFQPNAGNTEQVDAAFKISSGEFGFQIGEYDETKPLVIDPVLSYELSSYWGGTLTDTFSNITINPSSGIVYMTGRTVSTNYPVSTSAYQGTYGGGLFDVAMFAYNPSTHTVVFSSYLGGSLEERQFSNSTNMDSSGNMYVVGLTSSTNFPMLNAYDASYNGGLFDGFLTKFTPSGALAYSTYLGGSDDDQCLGVDINSSNEAFVTCSTKSSNFPTLNALDAIYGGAALRDITLTKFTADGSALLFSTFYGGAGDDGSTGVVLDASQNPVVYGFTGTTGITHVNPYQGTYGGSTLDGLIVKYAADGTSITYSTYIGGNGLDSIRAFIHDSAGKMVITMSCGSTNMSTVTPFQGAIGGGFDNFVAKFNVAGNALEYGSYYGGSGTESPFSIAIDSDNTTYVVGSTASTNLPLTTPLQGTSGGGSTDIMLFALPSSGAAIMFSTYLGGSATDSAQAIALDTNRRIVIGGQSTSTNFPQLRSLQSTNQGAEDGLIIRIAYGDFSGGGGGPAPYLAVQEPGGFEIFKGGEVVEVKWFVQSMSESLHAAILLSTDAGKTFSEVVKEAPLEGPSTFTVPYLDHDAPSKIRVEIRDTTGKAHLSDESDYFFTIKQTAAPTIVAPPMPVEPTPIPPPEEPLPQAPEPVAPQPEPLPPSTPTPTPIPVPVPAPEPKPATVKPVDEKPDTEIDVPMSEPGVVVNLPESSSPSGLSNFLSSLATIIRNALLRLIQYFGF